MSDAAEVVYREMRQQISDQSAEIERVDRKAAALLTPIGLLIGLAINSRSLIHSLRPVDAVLFAGLALELFALVAAVVALWPRKFRRPVPGSPQHRMAIGGIGASYFDPHVSLWRRTVAYTHLRAHETRHDLVCRLLLEKKK